jgi:hypothetical protein
VELIIGATSTTDQKAKPLSVITCSEIILSQGRIICAEMTGCSALTLIEENKNNS